MQCYHLTESQTNFWLMINLCWAGEAVSCQLGPAQCWSGSPVANTDPLTALEKRSGRHSSISVSVVNNPVLNFWRSCPSEIEGLVKTGPSGLWGTDIQLDPAMV